MNSERKIDFHNHWLNPIISRKRTLRPLVIPVLQAFPMQRTETKSWFRRCRFRMRKCSLLAFSCRLNENESDKAERIRQQYFVSFIENCCEFVLHWWLKYTWNLKHWETKKDGGRDSLKRFCMHWIVSVVPLTPRFEARKSYHRKNNTNYLFVHLLFYKKVDCWAMYKVSTFFRRQTSSVTPSLWYSSSIDQSKLFTKNLVPVPKLVLVQQLMPEIYFGHLSLEIFRNQTSPDVLFCWENRQLFLNC